MTNEGKPIDAARANAYLRHYNTNAKIDRDTKPIKSEMWNLCALMCLAARHAAAVSEPAALTLIRADLERSPYKREQPKE